MIIKVPKVNQIGSMKYTVGIEDYLRCDNAWKAYFNERTNEIIIDSQVTGNMRDRSYMHEVIHQIDVNYGCGLSEEVIDRLANGFCEYLFNNLGIELDWSDVDLPD